MNILRAIIGAADEKVVDDPGGVLSLIGRNISSFKQISQWFSDAELKEVTKLILTDNKINSFEGVNVFEKTRELDLSSNRIHKNAIEDKNVDISFIDTIVLKNNPIEVESIIQNLPANITLNTLDPCSNCGYTRTEFMKKNYDSLCKACDSKIKEEKNIKEMVNAIVNDPLMQRAFNGPQKAWYINLVEAYYENFGFKGIIAIAIALLFLYVYLFK